MSKSTLSSRAEPIRMDLKRSVLNTLAALAAVIALACGTSTADAATAIPCAGGELIPVSSPGTGYANDNNHPWPYMAFLPAGYSAANGPYPLVFCLHGDGEVGNGSSDGTLVASSTNQLAYLFGSGVLPLIKAGCTYFGDQKVIVVQPQSNVGNGSAFDLNRTDLTMRLILSTYNIDRSRIYATGLSAGGGGVTRFAYSYAKNANYSLAAVIPIADIQGLGTTYTDFSIFTNTITWFIQDSDDTIAPAILQSGRIYSGYGDGWCGGISRAIDQATLGGALPADTIKDRCLTTHPDYAAINACGFNTNGTIPASVVSGTYTANYDPKNAKGWTWTAGETFTGTSRLAMTLIKGGGHGGWWATYGTGTAENLPFWTWLLAQRLGQAPTGFGAPAPVPAAVAVTPTSATLTVGQTQQLVAKVLDANGAAISPQPALTWSCSTGGNVSSSGVFTAVAAASAVTVTVAVPGTAVAAKAVVTVAAVTTGTVQVHPLDTTTPKPPYGYLSYLPEGYNAADTTTKWPLVIYLPNTTEAGDGTDTAANGHQLTTQMEKYGPFHQIVTAGFSFPAIIIAPQVTTNWTKPANVKAMLTYVEANYHVDVNSVTMTGNLEGASGALRYVAAYPTDIAGILVIEAGTAETAAAATAAKGIPMWASHSFDDNLDPRTWSIGWTDGMAVAANGGSSNCMGTYPGYGDSNHYAVDTNATTHAPATMNGQSLTIAGATVTKGSTTVTFPSGTTFGSAVFNMWGGTTAAPFATMTIAGSTYVITRGFPGSVTLATACTAASGTATVTIGTPVGYDATAYRSTNGTWGWNRGQGWDQTHPDNLVLTLFWNQDPTNAWTSTWSNEAAWDWLLARTRTPSANG